MSGRGGGRIPGGDLLRLGHGTRRVLCHRGDGCDLVVASGDLAGSPPMPLRIVLGTATQPPASATCLGDRRAPLIPAGLYDWSRTQSGGGRARPAGRRPGQ